MKKITPRVSTAASIKRLTAYEGEYNLYEMTVHYDYDLDALIGEVARDDQAFMDAAVAQALPGVSVKVAPPSFGCSAFCAKTDTAVLTGRNYDFKEDTSALLVRANPKNGYASIAFACLNNLGANEADTSIEKRAASLLAPFACLDGVNAMGVSIAVLTLDSEPVDQHTKAEAINTALTIRLVLDRAATTKEAVGLLGRYDMHAMSGRDYHFFINDASGDSVVVEYDLLDPAREMMVTPVREITNYYALYADQVKPNQINDAFGHGKERALAIAAILDKGAVTVDTAWAALQASSQVPNPEDITSNTQWSVLYDNTNQTAQCVQRRHWGDTFLFTLD
jgi:hypothetical protein